MHRYLKCIGFQAITTRKQLKGVFDTVLNQPDTVQYIPTEEEDNRLCVLTKNFAPGMGLALCGNFNEDDDFELEFYYPYFYSDVSSTFSPATFERQGEKDSYMGSCDDYNVGITLIFYLSNFMDMRELTQELGYLPAATSIRLTGLAEEGKVLLPIHKTIDEEAAWKASKVKCDMVEAAKKGDRSAMEYLTRQEMRTFARVNREVSTTDIYTLVNSFFMPNGVECDHYSILGEIEDVKTIVNSITSETVYRLLLNCNSIHLSVIINQADLLGVPEKGRRFKGKIWLQAFADFESDNPY